jgi:phosphate acyltransferase
VYMQLQEIIKKHFLAQIMGKLLSRPLKKLFKPMNPDQYNGASLIGLRGIVVKSHGNANVTAFYTAIMEAVTEVERQVPNKIKAKLEHGLCDKE